ncbi:MAG: RNA 2',3'-cyclic phosphodiesterase [Deltaproteobacteria bacterium]|nr:RNA 2',3'-cyclic phosphodiesterase [Deltaproteobacteria bacterium]
MRRSWTGGQFNIAIRAFIAIELPEKLIAALNAIETELKGKCGLTKGWVRPESIHLTVKFLGDVDEKKLPEIAAALKNSASGCGPFTLTAAGYGGFPGLRAPRVLWMGVKDSPELQRLQQNIEDRLGAIGIAKENRQFSAHLTFLRIKSPADGRIAGAAAENLKHEISMDFYVDSFVLFKSTLSPKGARHDIVERIKL